MKGTGVDIKLSKTQLGKQGGVLGALLGGLTASILPQLLGGILGKGVVLPGSRPSPRTYYKSKPVQTHGEGIKKKKKKGKGVVLPGTYLPPPFIGTWKERY